ncbi:MAG: hypothetical protein P1U89_09320 [Verrucomicrobiales bacterium]|nr:hypothetical protein [Verrucomicrobiales bacterium]
MKLPSSNGELLVFHSYDSGEVALDNLQMISEAWSILWPRIELLSIDGIKTHDTGQVISAKTCSGFIEFPDEEDEDDNDFMIGFQFSNDVPGWDFHIKDWEVSEYQPVY